MANKLDKIIQAQRAGESSEYDAIIYAAGVKEGKRQMRIDMLSWLEEEYLKPDVAIGDTKGEAILALARQLSEAFKI